MWSLGRSDAGCDSRRSSSCHSSSCDHGRLSRPHLVFRVPGIRGSRPRTPAWRIRMTHAQTLAIAAAVGLLSGTHAAIWGMYKDSLHEGYDRKRFARSMFLGAAAGALLQNALRLTLPAPGAIALLFGLA